jgi:hypothetical protein
MIRTATYPPQSPRYYNGGYSNFGCYIVDD